MTWQSRRSGTTHFHDVIYYDIETRGISAMAVLFEPF